jgi:hypothetical protein
MWACHNDREEDQLRSPRESRVTVTHRFRVVKATAWTAAHAPRDSIRTHRIAHPFDAVQGENGGGDEGTRTPDPLLAKEVLSQLSYIPIGRADRIGATGRGQSQAQRNTTVRCP